MSTFMPNMTILLDTDGSASHRLICFFPAFATATTSGQVWLTAPPLGFTSSLLHAAPLASLPPLRLSVGNFSVIPNHGQSRKCKGIDTHCGCSGPFSLLSCDLSILRHSHSSSGGSHSDAMPVVHCSDYLAKAPWDWLSPLTCFTLSSFPLLFLELLPKINLRAQLFRGTQKTPR